MIEFFFHILVKGAFRRLFRIFFLDHRSLVRGDIHFAPARPATCLSQSLLFLVLVDVCSRWDRYALDNGFRSLELVSFHGLPLVEVHHLKGVLPGFFRKYFGSIRFSS